MDEFRIKLEERLLDRIKGSINLSQSLEAKERAILDAFLGFYDTGGLEECREGMKYLKDDGAQKEFLEELKGYGIINPFLDDPQVEDIVINNTEPIYVHHARDGLIKTNVRFSSLRELDILIKKIVVFSGRSNLNKINNIDLPGMRGRVNIVYSPFGPDLTIAKIRTQTFSIIDLIENGTINSKMAALLWLFIEGLRIRPANVLISGGPGSGKTTLLNALLDFIPSNQHLVVIEDSLELVTNFNGNVSRLESDDEISLADLVKNSLRMRPERIVVGEVRGSEAQDMITAMNIGKYCMATIHSSTVRETILRLQNNPMNVSETMINLIDIFVVMKKIDANGRVLRVCDEIAETSGLEQKTVLISPLWEFDSASANFKQRMPTTVYRDRLAEASGLSGRLILDEIEKRQDYLERLVAAKIRGIKDVSISCERYISDYEGAISDIYSSMKNKGEGSIFPSP